MAVQPTRGTTGTGLDVIIDWIYQDTGLTGNAPYDNVIGGTEAADAMNHIIIDIITANGLLDDGVLDTNDILVLHQEIRANYLAEWTALHGDDDGNIETGFHLIQGDGGTLTFEGDALIDTVFDGIYHLGFELAGPDFLNEDGTPNTAFTDLSHWLNTLLGDGTSYFFGSPGDDWLEATQDADTISLSDGNDGAMGRGGNDTMNGEAGDDWLHGGDGDDLITGGTGNDGLVGARGQDHLIGDAGDDSLSGGADDDLLEGGRGHDSLYGGDGNDRLEGGVGNDWMVGGKGDDFMLASGGDDGMAGGPGNDRMLGGNGMDSLSGQDGNDVLIGGADDDSLNGGQGRDRLDGGTGGDWLSGGRGNDLIFGGDGDDSAVGGADNDRISGGNGNDWMKGGQGNDLLFGGGGDDYMVGGAGADAFLFAASDNGNDYIQGFRAGDGDRLVIQSGMDVAVEDLGGNDTRVTFTDAATGDALGSVVVSGDFSATDIVVDDLLFF